MVPLSRERVLLGAAVGYALAGATIATPQLLSRPTPCAGWDLETLLEHLGDSMGALAGAIVTGSVPDAASPHPPGAGPVARLRGHAARLLAAWAAAPQAGRLVVIGDRELTARMVAVAGAIEITVHGWDIFAACGIHRPVPQGLAAVLLPIAPLLVTPGTRAGLFDAPVRLDGPACPGDRLVAFLGRDPWRAAAPGQAAAEPGGG
jgi:uncharacterized protein (TIGR03086 family)